MNSRVRNILISVLMMSCVVVAGSAKGLTVNVDADNVLYDDTMWSSGYIDIPDTYLTDADVLSVDLLLPAGQYVELTDLDEETWEFIQIGLGFSPVLPGDPIFSVDLSLRHQDGHTVAGPFEVARSNGFDVTIDGLTAQDGAQIVSAGNSLAFSALRFELSGPPDGVTFEHIGVSLAADRVTYGTTTVPDIGTTMLLLGLALFALCRVPVDANQAETSVPR